MDAPGPPPAPSTSRSRSRTAPSSSGSGSAGNPTTWAQSTRRTPRRCRCSVPTGSAARCTARTTTAGSSIGESDATPGCLAGPIPAGTWVINVYTGLILPDGARAGHLDWHLEVSARLGDADRRGGRPATSRAPATHARRRRALVPRRPPLAHGPQRRRRSRSRTGSVARSSAGSDFLAITDHNTISHHRELDAWPDGITPIRGSEVTTFHGHINCFGLSDGDRLARRPPRRRRGGDHRAGPPPGRPRLDQPPERLRRPVVRRLPLGLRPGGLRDVRRDRGLERPAGPMPRRTTTAALALLDGPARCRASGRPRVAARTAMAHGGGRRTRPSAEPTSTPTERNEAAILDGIRRGRVFLSSGPTLSFQARGSDGVEVTLPGEHLPADGALRLTVDIERLEAPATLWFVTSGSAIRARRVRARDRARRRRNVSSRPAAGGGSSCARGPRRTATSWR